MSDLHRYTTFKVSKALGEVLDLWIHKNIDYLKLNRADSRSAAVEYILMRVFEAEGMVKPPNLGVALWVRELRNLDDAAKPRA